MATAAEGDSSLLTFFAAFHQQQQQQQQQQQSSLITRDFLGGPSPSSSSSSHEPGELDFDLDVPPGYEKRLDLKSGKIYLQRCNSPDSSTSSAAENRMRRRRRRMQVYQETPIVGEIMTNVSSAASVKRSLTLFDDSSLDLKLSSSSTNYQSVCTLDKVKSALKREEKNSAARRQSCWVKEGEDSGEGGGGVDESWRFTEPLFAAGCQRCLTYVLISKNNPMCPRCHTVVPLPLFKKPCIDLNVSV